MSFRKSDFWYICLRHCFFCGCTGLFCSRLTDGAAEITAEENAFTLQVTVPVLDPEDRGLQNE